MAKRITREIALARAAAYESAAEHLQLRWTDDPLEIEQGGVVSDKLIRLCSQWEAIAEALKAREARSNE